MTEKLTQQEMFTKMVTHLRKQGRKSISLPGNTCRYRGVDNTACAVGCLIPDDVYTPHMEGRLVWGLPDVCGGLDKLPWTASDVRLLSCMQEVHDWTEVEEWENEFKKIANAHGLVIPDAA